MDLIPYVVAYIAIGIFIVAVVARFFMWSRLPMHVRWELYPVAHEAKRAHYGGSYLEETDWWKKPRESSMVGELKVMVPEIIFLEALHKHNRKLWYSSFPFHFGLYLIIGSMALLMLTAFLTLVAPSLLVSATGEQNGLAGLLKYLIIGCGAAGLVLNILGAVGLLIRRLTDPELKDFTAPADLFNLFIFLVASGWALTTFILVDNDFSRVQGFVYNLISFRMVGLGGSSGMELFLPFGSVILLSVLVAYIPLTHMSHFVGKFFAYHAIRWNDTPNLPGSDEEVKIKEVLSYPVSWAAPHIRGNGQKTWADVATEEQKK